MGLFAYIALRFAVTMVEQGLLKIFPAPWVAVLLPLILLLALVPGFLQKHEIKLWVMSAYTQANDVILVAGGFNPIVRVNENGIEGGK